MLSPNMLIFCNAHWQVLGYQLRHHDPSSRPSFKGSIPIYYGPCLQSELSSITKIHEDFFSGAKSLREASIAQRVGWASRRATTRVEDEAYCLLGIFDINMPLIYGEGRKAFTRLQEEIMRRSTDQSILAWNTSSNFPSVGPVLVSTPKDFPIVKHEEEMVDLDGSAFTVTNKGLEIRADITELQYGVMEASAEQRQDDWIDKRHGYCYLLLSYERRGKRRRILLKYMRANLYYRVNQGKEDELGAVGEERDDLLKG